MLGSNGVSSQKMKFVVLLIIISSSAGEESACNAGELGLILGLGRSLGEGIGYSCQYSLASLVVQTVKILPHYGRPGCDPGVGKIH